MHQLQSHLELHLTRKTEHKEVKWLAQGHTMSQWLRWDLNQGLPNYKPFSLTTGPHCLWFEVDGVKVKHLVKHLFKSYILHFWISFTETCRLSYRSAPLAEQLHVAAGTASCYRMSDTSSPPMINAYANINRSALWGLQFRNTFFSKRKKTIQFSRVESAL